MPETDIETAVKDMWQKTQCTIKNGDIVTHLTFGKGVVVSVDDKFITIAFHQRFGVKKFLKNYKGIRKVK